MNIDEFVDLNRKFYQVSKADDTTEEQNLEVQISLGLGSETTAWEDIFKEYRTILLSEAGTGKTAEIEMATLKLREKGKHAFFLRLEHIPTDFENAFEIGSKREFEDWIESNEEGWLLLDSVDEARLKSAQDFKMAVRVVAKRIGTAIKRTHIIITSRNQAWRPKADLSYCNEKFSFKSTNDDRSVIKKDFKIYSLADLDQKQVKAFSEAKGISDVEQFLDDIKRHDAFHFTKRPQDLSELIDYWIENKKIGSRLELIRYSLKKRLSERDPDRAENDSLSLNKSENGARKIAAAATLSNRSLMSLPDSQHDENTIDTKNILADWEVKECTALLSRSIFSGAILGSVRFYHRSIREYLTAEWFSLKLKNEGFRSGVEGIFFKEQYGLKVIPPSMKPILSWLVLFDEKIRNKAYKIEPEIFLEGGDPMNLPFVFRKKVLNEVCSRIAADKYHNSVHSYKDIQRFAHLDMAADVKNLLHKFEKNSNVLEFLLNMAWLGRIKIVLPHAKIVALESEFNKHTTVAAIKVIGLLGSAADCFQVLENTLKQNKAIDRYVLSNLVRIQGVDKKSVGLIVKSLSGAAEAKRFGVDNLSDDLSAYLLRLNPSLIFYFIESVNDIIHEQPLISYVRCKVSKKHAWLIEPLVKAIGFLIKVRSEFALHEKSLSLIKMSKELERYGGASRVSNSSNIEKLIYEWPELNQLLFWYCVKDEREKLSKGQRLTNFWRACFMYKLFRFSPEDFEDVLKDISERELDDDKLVALSLAFEIYTSNGMSASWLEKIQEVTASSQELSSALESLLNPPAPSAEMLELEERRKAWDNKHEAEQEHQYRNKQKDIAWLKENYKLLEKSEYLNQGVVTNLQSYLLREMRENCEKSSSSYSIGEWENLIEVYGKDVARSFRIGLLHFWRNYDPPMQSVKEKDHRITELGVMVGLAGLTIEATENKDLSANLTNEDAAIVTRYACRELNGFPDWFSAVQSKFPEITNSILLNEIDWELRREDAKTAYLNILSKICWSERWLDDEIGQSLLKLLKREPVGLKSLELALNIVQKSNQVSDIELSKIARRKTETLKKESHLSYWYAVWVGVEPEEAIDSLENFLNQKVETQLATDFTMSFIVKLVGNYRDGSAAREKYKDPKVLKRLYLLMNKYIRVDDDLDRSGQGAYSPGLRDNAQDARNSLYAILKDIPGKETYLALYELAEIHPRQSSREWIAKQARNRAELDSETQPLNLNEFKDFDHALNYTPANSKELFELCIQRLIDLKADLEDGDNSIATILDKIESETEFRKYFGGWCRERSSGKYTVTQEEEFADAKKPDLRFHGIKFDNPVPVELKLVDNKWSGAKLFERLENQLCGDYLRDEHSKYGIFMLVYQGRKKAWMHPDSNARMNFEQLVSGLSDHWKKNSSTFPNILDIKVVGIDLTKRNN